MKWWRKKGRIALLGSVAEKRRRDRWLLVILIVASSIVVGHWLVQSQQKKVAVVKKPITHSATVTRPLTAAGNDATTNDTPDARNCDDLRVLVDRSHTLPPDYFPSDLVSLEAYGVPVHGDDAYLRRGAAEQLRRLISEAATDGKELVVASAYRSYADQQASFARLASIYGRNAGWMSATPGRSQHQLGTAVDFTNAAASYQVWLPFGETSASWWLKHHAPKYGFVLAYPNGKESQTGFQYEPWHYRYIGVGNARRLQESGLTLQEFLEREGVLPRC